MLDVLGLANLLERQSVEVPAEIRSLADAREQARARRDFARGRRAAGRAARARLGGPRRARRTRVAAGGVIIYGRNPVREAIRGPRAVKRVWGTRNALREPWLAALVAVTTGAERRRARAAVRLAAITRGCAPRSRRSSTWPPTTLLALRGSRSSSRSIRSRIPRTWARSPRSAECAGASGLVLPERRSAEVTPAVCKASAGAVEHLPIAQGPQPRRLPGRRQARRPVVLRRRPGRRPRPTRPSITAGGSVLVLGSEGRGLRPRVAGACDALVSIPLRGRIESLSVSAAAAVLMFEVARNRQASLQPALDTRSVAMSSSRREIRINSSFRPELRESEALTPCFLGRLHTVRRQGR